MNGVFYAEFFSLRLSCPFSYPGGLRCPKGGIVEVEADCGAAVLAPAEEQR